MTYLNFYDTIDNMFGNLIDRYDNNIELINDIIDIKSFIINEYMNSISNDTDAKKIIKKLTVKKFKITENGSIQSL